VQTCADVNRSTVIQTTASPIAAANLLSLLERLNTFPTEAAELNEWWVPELGVKPKGKGKAAAPEDEDEEPEVPEGDDDDWRKFFDDQDKPAPGMAAKTPAKVRRPTTLHASLHALSAHRAVFTRCWLALLPRLGTPTLASRALAIFHRLVLPHLTRPVLVADWVGEAVDAGGATGLLALDTLFLLMTAYNL
jgi:U3 small nucleolar RNA-associated protein 19